MSRSVYGWHYPPGAEHDPNAPWNQKENVCEVCKNYSESCDCPECPNCGEVGDPACEILRRGNRIRWDNHFLVGRSRSH